MDMSVEELTGGVTKVIFDGRLDIAGASAIDLRLSALAGSRGALLVDLRLVSFLASMGIRTLVSAAKAVRAKGGKMVLLAPEPNVEKVLRSAGIDTVIPIFEAEGAAIEAVGA